MKKLTQNLTAETKSNLLTIAFFGTVTTITFILWAFSSTINVL